MLILLGCQCLSNIGKLTYRAFWNKFVCVEGYRVHLHGSNLRTTAVTTMDQMQNCYHQGSNLVSIVYAIFDPQCCVLMIIMKYFKNENTGKGFMTGRK